jgi:exodeoxyribonuclease-5
VFVRAATEYLERLDENFWTDAAGLFDRVIRLIEDGRVPQLPTTLFAGFDRVSPALGALLAALGDQGCAARLAPAGGIAPRVSLARFERPDQEWRSAGAWARTRLSANPGCRLAIICPSLDVQAPRVAAAVREGMVPGWQFGGARWKNSVNVSYGRRLIEHAAIHVALLILRWAADGLVCRELSVLLRSRCLGSEELQGRYRMELALRQYPDRHWTTANFRQALAGIDRRPDSLEFLQLAAAIGEFTGGLDTPRSPAEQVDLIGGLLDSVGWPGQEALASEEFQLVNRWRELLNDIARTGCVSRSVTLRQVIRQLATFAADIVWQPKAEHEQAVQVIGVYEAAGMEFDGIWVSGMDASQWPAAGRPSPFIARELQRRYDLPDATPEATRAFARVVLDRLTSAAGECVLSWSQMEGDAELTASPLLDMIPTRPYDGPPDPGRFLAGLTCAPLEDANRDDEAPPLLPGERVRGGAYTVQRQLEEPFAAFVFARLGYQPIYPIVNGLAPGVRGSIIHEALRLLLADNPSQQEIIGWTDDARSRRIGAAVDTALTPLHESADALLKSLLLLERRRLRSLLQGFLDGEAVRSSFTVAAVEKSVDYQASGVALGLRIDRLDRLEDGRLAIIDYKTGAARGFLNREGEPGDWQLVVYADALDEPVGALGLLNLDSRTIAYRGVGGEWTPVDNWDETLERWRKVVHRALQEFGRGDVRINTRQSISDGRQLSLLSRLEELRHGD